MESCYAAKFLPVLYAGFWQMNLLWDWELLTLKSYLAILLQSSCLCCIASFWQIKTKRWQKNFSLSSLKLVQNSIWRRRSCDSPAVMLRLDSTAKNLHHLLQEILGADESVKVKVKGQVSVQQQILTNFKYLTRHLQDISDMITFLW